MRIIYNLKVCNHITNFFTVIESVTADYTVRNTAS